jgi:Exonuclease V - a 5' deoxyribonuclease
MKTMSTAVREASAIIGKKEFALDERIIETYLVNVLQFWNGKRAARGVEEEQSRRCLSVMHFFSCSTSQSLI